MASTKNLTKIVKELQPVYWQKQFGALTAQAEEVRVLSAKVTADTTEPIKAHATRSMDELRKVHGTALRPSFEGGLGKR